MYIKNECYNIEQKINTLYSLYQIYYYTLIITDLIYTTNEWSKNEKNIFNKIV